MIFDFKNIDLNLVNNLTIENFEENESSKKEKGTSKKGNQLKEVLKKDESKIISRKSKKKKLDYTKIMKDFENKAKSDLIVDKNIKKTRATYDDWEIFDWSRYIENNKDLNNFKNKEDAWYHWCNFGANEGRVFYEDRKKKKVYNLFKFNETNDDSTTQENNSRINLELYQIFDWKLYTTIYYDLSHFKTKEEAWNHYITYGKNENRIFTKMLDYSSDSDTNSDKDTISEESQTLTDISLINESN